MPHSKSNKKITFAGPATYRIDVLGRLEEKWSSRLSGMRVMPSSHGGEPQLTILVGRVSDQAELLGVLNALYELHMPLLYLRQLDEE